MSRAKKQQWIWMIPVLLLVMVLGTIHLTDDAIWFDEWITYFITGTGGLDERSVEGLPLCGEVVIFQTAPLDMVCLAAIDNSWPPAFFILLGLWDKVVSFGVLLSDRALALFIGLLSVAITYRFGKKLFNHQVGLMAALLLGTSALFVYYLHEVRGYTLYVLFPALNGWLYWRLLTNYERTKRATRWGFVLSLAGSLYTHYIASAAVLGIGIYHFFFERPRQNSGDTQRLRPRYWSAILKLWVNGCLFFAPWVAVLIVSFLNESVTNRSVSTWTLLNNMLYGFANNLWWVALPSLLASLITWRKREMRFLWVWGLTILGVAILGNIFADFLFHPRHIIGIMPTFALLVVAGLMTLFQKRQELVWVFVGIWVGAGMIYSVTPDFMNALPRHISTIPQTAMDTIVETVNDCAASDDLVVLGIDTPDTEWVYTQPVEYYLPDVENLTLLGLLVTDERQAESPLLPEALQEADFASRVDAFTENMPTVWLFTLPDLPIQDNLLTFDTLLQERNYTPCTIVNRDDILGIVYTQSSSCERVVSCAGQ
ncbi:MAG: glycosyltransferase family 39 protein [Anaerolineae bacterium]|nr:glycosyltransferase family 39 protein [Anaerolineae bacterium]MDQ7034774.1 glycosyltransferase family 39 protein [Anaerolineae bacterium]